MRKKMLLVAVVLLLLPLSQTYGFSEKGQDCSKCHTLSNEEATTLMGNLNPGIKVFEVRSGPVAGIWEVVIETGGRKMPVYVHFSKNHLISGEIFDIKEKKSLTRERMADINRVDVSQIPLADALVMGEKDAKHRVIVFDDPD